MKTVKLTKLQREEIAWKIELAQSRYKEELTKLEDRLDFESFYKKITRTKNGSVSLTSDQRTWIQHEMSNALDLHGTSKFVGDMQAVGYTNMVNNLFKKLDVEYVDTLQAHKITKLI